MKHLTLLGCLLFSALAWGADAKQTLDITCHSSFGASGRIMRGYQLEIYRVDESTGPVYHASLTPLCITCFIRPITWAFESKTPGMQTIYKGKEGTLEIVMESFAPTKSHPGALTSVHLNQGKRVPFTCGE